MTELQTLMEQLLFGGSSPEASGGLMEATGLDEAHVVYEMDPGERPARPFMTFAFPSPASGVLYGPAANPYVTVTADPAEDTNAVLGWDNAHTLGLRLCFYGKQPEQTIYTIQDLAQAAREYLISKANRDLTLAGYGGEIHVSDPGRIRDASTVLNEETEVRLAFDAQLVIGEAVEVSVEAVEKLVMTFKAGSEPEGPEEEIEL